MTETILSMSNSKVKELVKLRESSKRRKDRQHFVVEGYSDSNKVVPGVLMHWNILNK